MYSIASLGFARWVNVLNHGLVADGETRNELALARLMRESARNSTFFFPAAYAPYLFGALPEEYNSYPLNPGEPGTPVAINCDAYGANIRGEHMNASTIKLLPGTAGILITGGITPSVNQLENFTIQGPGVSADGDGRNEQGEWSKEHKHYRYPGVIGNSQIMMDRVIIRECSEGFVSIGFTNIVPTGIPVKFQGTLAVLEGQPQYMVLHPYEDTYGIENLRKGWQVTVQGVQTNIPFYSTPNTIYLNGRPEMVPGENVEIEVRPEGGKLINAYSDISRCAFINNLGCGAYIQGNEANQIKFWGCTFVGNGWMAFDDISFLAAHFIGGHIATNGGNFNKRKDQNGWEGEDENRVNCFRAGVIPTSASTLLCVYTESDQGPGYVGQSAEVHGGNHAAKLEGPGSWQKGPQVNRVHVGNVELDEYGLALRRDDDTQPLTYRFDADGLEGFYFGNERTGSHGHPVLQFVRPGTAYAGIPAPLGAIVAPEYRLLGGASILSAVSLQEHLKTLGERPARTGQVLIISEPTPGPQSYLCRTGGDADACLFEPQGIGRGAPADRPAPETLTRHDVGYKWLSTATGVESTLVGAAWAEPAPPALEPPTADFTPDSSPLVYYSEGDWQHHQNNDFRNGDAVTRAPTVGPGFIEHAFTSQGQADEWIARHLVIDDNHLFAVFLNGEKVLERTAPGPAVASFGDRIIQHFVSAQFWNGEPERFPSFVLQPAAGENRLRVESYTPGAPAQNFYDDGTSCCLRGKMAQA